MQKKISIIIPVYNTEQYVDRCIQSIMRQSYRDLEIIIVNDGSKGDISARITKYQEKDSRIRYVENQENLGLFCARVEGSKAVTGDYIAFVDSDDYVSYDFFRSLIAKAEAENAEITIGKTVWQDGDQRFIYNFHDSCFPFAYLEGEDARNEYFSQEAQCYSWHTVWNKLYSMQLWNRCSEFFQSIKKHVVMTEDILFSSVLFFKASSVAIVNNDAYFYCVNDGASTNSKNLTIEKFKKNIGDINFVFDTVDSFLKSADASVDIQKHFQNARYYYAQMWLHYAKDNYTGKDLDVCSEVLSRFFDGEIIAEDTSNFFESVKTVWNGGLEYLKEQIGLGEEKYVCFDVFDTLITRPFYHPDEVFHLLDATFYDLTHSAIRFSTMRTKGEEYARRALANEKSGRSDLTLREIYEFIAHYYTIPDDVAEALYQKEILLENEFSRDRSAGHELFDLAVSLGKEVVLISDMYLEKNVIIGLLEQNGYTGYSEVFVSSEYGCLKGDGKLYEEVMSYYQEPASSFLHIGDSWASDIEGAQKAGIKAFFLPKSSEVFENKIQGCDTNICAAIGYRLANRAVNTKKLQENDAYQLMRGLICKKYFDNPYRAFNRESAFNIDPYFVGYYALGMHLAGMIKWVVHEMRSHRAETIHFCSRDGFLLKKAFDEYQEITGKSYDSSYIQTSRKALLPAMVMEQADFYQLPVEPCAHSPKSLLGLLAFSMKKGADEDGFIQTHYNGDAEEKFLNREEYEVFIRRFLDELYCPDRHKEAKERVRKYYSSLIQPDDLVFDAGYSGRIAHALSSCCGFPVHTLYIHEDYNNSVHMRYAGGFDIASFYDFRPVMTGLIREEIISDYESGCVGFTEENGRIVPVMDDRDVNVPSKFVIKMLHRGAIDFIKDYFTTTKHYQPQFDYSPLEVSLAFEGFLREENLPDRHLFSESYFEDELYGGQDHINVEQFTQCQIEEMRPDPLAEKGNLTESELHETMIDILNRSGKIKRAILLLTVNKRLFWEKFKKNINPFSHKSVN